MNFLYLKYAAEVERTGSISKAAQNLYMGQPNLSKAIKELESEIGLTLFRRTPKGVETTPPGREFLARAKNVLADMRELEERYRRGAAEEELSVSVPRATYISMAFVKFLESEKSGMRARYRETDALAAIGDVLSGDSGLGIVRAPEGYESFYERYAEESGLKSEALADFRMSLLIGSASPLAAFGEVPFRALEGLLELAEGDFRVPSVEGARAARERQSGSRVLVFDRGSQYDILKRMPESYMWVSPVPEDVLMKEGLLLKPCTGAFRAKDFLVYKRNHAFTRAERSFLAEVRAYYSSFFFELAGK